MTRRSPSRTTSWSSAMRIRADTRAPSPNGRILEAVSGGYNSTGSARPLDPRGVSAHATAGVAVRRSRSIVRGAHRVAPARVQLGLEGERLREPGPEPEPIAEVDRVREAALGLGARPAAEPRGEAEHREGACAD